MLPNKMDIVIKALKFRIEYLEYLGTFCFGILDALKVGCSSKEDWEQYFVKRERSTEVKHLKNAIRHLEKEMGK